MKIVHVNFSDTKGGAAIAVKRIHKLLLKNNINSQIVVSEKNDDMSNVFSLNKTSENIKNTIKTSISRQLRYIFKTENKNTHSLNVISSKNLALINSLKPDYVNLHWIGNETISISDINKINAKIVWTLHDMWPFCGAEHYTDDLRYVDGYAKNNRPDHEKGIDVNKLIWKKKLKHFTNVKKIICTSNWMYNCAKKSYLFKDKDISEIPLMLDLNIWKPFKKKYARNFFDIDSERKVILYGADNYLKNNRKGFGIFKKAISEIKKNYQEEITVILFGTNELLSVECQTELMDIKIINLGKIADENLLRLVYSCSDLVVIPSLTEAFGLIALESIHCGTPCVVFENTGLTSIIVHKENGYVAKYNSIEDLKAGIIWALKNLINSSQSIYKKALVDFDNNKIFQRYIEFLRK
jgi:glycosyltransferase involved in cell wall biosynthesis